MRYGFTTVITNRHADRRSAGNSWKRRPTRLALAVFVLATSTVTMIAGTPVPADAQVSVVTLYDAVNYGGTATPVQGNMPGMTGFGATRGLSIRIPLGMKVAVFSGSGYQSWCEVLTADDPNTNVGNSIPSLFPLSPISAVMLNSDCGITLYDAGNYGATSWTVGDVRNLATLGYAGRGWMDDRVSSFKVPLGQKVTAFELETFRGVCEVLSGDDPDMRNNRLGNDRISSIRLDDECPIKLYGAPNYGGGEIDAWVPDRNMGGILGLWNDALSAIRITPGQGQKLAVYEHDDYEGECETFTADDPDLSNNRIGDNRASSYRVNEWCRVTLFEHRGFDGRSLIVANSITDLRDPTYNFNDFASSVRIQGGVVAAWSSINFTGTCETFTDDDDYLPDNRIGNDPISSIQMGVSCPATA